MKLVVCNLCGSSSYRRLFTTQDFHYKTTDETFTVVKCDICELVYLNPQPETSEINRFYPNTYRPHKAKRLHQHAYTAPKHPIKRVLDIGCGSGDFLLELAEKHSEWDLYGVDFDERAVNQARQLGFSVHHGSVQDAKYIDNFFDEIYMNHVLEHTPNPLETLKETCRILKPNRHLIILIPNFRSLSRFIFRKYWYHIDTPRHLYHFSPKTLTGMLKKSGLGYVRMTFIPSPKYFLQSYAFWAKEKKQSYPKWIWKALVLPALVISILHLSSTMLIFTSKVHQK